MMAGMPGALSRAAVGVGSEMDGRGERRPYAMAGGALDDGGMFGAMVLRETLRGTGLVRVERGTLY
jgi:hypothetical protein